MNVYPITFKLSDGTTASGELVTDVTLPIVNWNLSPAGNGSLYSATPTPPTPQPNWANIPNYLNEAAALSVDLQATYLTPNTGNTVTINGTLPTGWSFAGTTLTYNGTGVGGPATISATATNGGGTASSNTFQVQGVGVTLVDNTAPTIPTNVVATPGVGQIVVTWDHSVDPYINASTPWSGVNGYNLSINGGASIFLPDPLAPGPENEYIYADIGATGIAGSGVQATNGTDWTLNSAGADIYGAADACGFLYTSQSSRSQYSQSCIITAFNASTQYAKAGVMYRISTAAGDVTALWVYQAVAQNIQLMARTASGGAMSVIATIPAPAAFPFALKLSVNQASLTSSFQFYAYLATPGQPYSMQATTTLGVTAFSRTFLVGLCACSHVAGTLAAATFTQVVGYPIGGDIISYTDGGLGNGVSRSYTLSAVDYASPSGNVSAMSTVVTATTLPAGGGGGGGTTLGIYVQGNSFYDLQSGLPTFFGGVAMFGLEQVYGGNPAGPPTPPYFAGFAANTQPPWSQIRSVFKAKAVRFALNAARVNGQTTVTADGRTWNFSPLQPAYLTFLDNAIAGAVAAGMYVSLDMHWTAPNNMTPGGQNGFLDANAQAAWVLLAKRYKNNPAVMFELFNEPYVHSAASGGTPAIFSNTQIPNSAAQNTTMRDGGTAIEALQWATGAGYGSSGYANVTYAVPGFNTVIAAIRATGATNVILVSCNSYANDPTMLLSTPPTDTLNQIGAVMHMYPNGTAGFGNDLTDPSLYSFTNTNVQAVIAKYPLIVTETAPLKSDGSSNYLMTGPVAGATGLFPYFQTNKISYCCWALCTATNDSAHNLITTSALALSSWGSAAAANMQANNP